jgi:hypothetical protein
MHDSLPRVTPYWMKLHTHARSVIDLFENKHFCHLSHFLKLTLMNYEIYNNCESLGTGIRIHNILLGSSIFPATNSWYVNILSDALKFSQAISHINVELKTNVSETSSISSIMVDVVNDRVWLTFIPVYQINASSYWCIMQWEGGVKLCGHPSDSNLPPCCLTWCPYCQTILFSFLHVFLCAFLGFSWCICAGVLYWVWFILSGCNSIYVASLASWSV